MTTTVVLNPTSPPPPPEALGRRLPTLAGARVGFFSNHKPNADVLLERTASALKARFAGMGGTPLPGSPSDFGKLIADETEKWGKVIRTAQIKPE